MELKNYEQTNILTKFHKDWMKTINILTKFHQDWMQTVTSTVYTNKLLMDGRTDTPRHAQRTPDITRSHKLTLSLHDSCRSSHCVNTFLDGRFSDRLMCLM
ncbi:hypothetical protein DPMN_028726 [Dreissena polymorpha]|uniref:Uncharacterized protein n=1 Tax=Dreissena polymorpha TaxID=45954 RepID=A0A9D4LXG1_DREPO|nr:hypothetical protein DPMN_028726 [Dreissena polymorpha]